tara:strand:- start:269 stop:400 length:132 start_codon:yes stop_codon:yes gene_type:complete
MPDLLARDIIRGDARILRQPFAQGTDVGVCAITPQQGQGAENF